MATLVFSSYVLWWFFTYGLRWSSRRMFWMAWMADVVVLVVSTNPILSQATTMGIHCVLAMVGVISPIFLAQCLISPFSED